jgi:hypothetical protein
VSHVTAARAPHKGIGARDLLATSGRALPALAAVPLDAEACAACAYWPGRPLPAGWCAGPCLSPIAGDDEHGRPSGCRQHWHPCGCAHPAGPAQQPAQQLAGRVTR